MDWILWDETEDSHLEMDLDGDGLPDDQLDIDGDGTMDVDE